MAGRLGNRLPLGGVVHVGVVPADEFWIVPKMSLTTDSFSRNVRSASIVTSAICGTVSAIGELLRDHRSHGMRPDGLLVGQRAKFDFAGGRNVALVGRGVGIVGEAARKRADDALFGKSG